MTDLDEIATFVRVIETQGFSKAAVSLGIPKSTVSRRVARLEEQLGVRLLHRTTRRMRATAEGQQFFDRVAPAVAALRLAAQDVAEGRDSPRGLLRMTAPVDFGHAYLAPVVAGFAAAHSDLEIRVVLTGRMVDMVKEGFDLAIRAGDLDDSSLIAKRLGVADFWLAASPGYLAERGIPRRVSELSEHECLGHRPKSRRRTWELTTGRTKVEVEVSGRVGADEFTFLAQAAIAGAGIVKLPAFIAIQPIADGRLVRVLPTHHIQGGNLHLVYPSAKQLPAKTAAFRDYLVANLADAPWAQRTR